VPRIIGNKNRSREVRRLSQWSQQEMVQVRKKAVEVARCGLIWDM
jgi:hypothetical protein